MKYDKPELQMKLAAEYVLGTLQGKARIRFERLLAHDSGLRARVAAWEQRLSPWASALKPQPVPATVWRGIQQRLGLAVASTPRVSLAWWRAWAVGSTAVAALLTAVIILQPMPLWPGIAVAWELTDLAVLTDKDGPDWIVRVDSTHQTLVLSSLGNKPLPVNKALELWSIPATGAPMSLGVLPIRGGKAELTLDKAHQARLQQAAVLAISLEPLGGSPTGLPTGPVLYTGKPASV